MSSTKNSISGNSSSGKFHFDGFSRFLRAAFPHATAAHVAGLAGAPTSTADKWLRGEARPSAAYFSTLAMALGPQFLSACTRNPAPWLERACEHEQRLHIENEITRLKTLQRSMPDMPAAGLR